MATCVGRVSECVFWSNCCLLSQSSAYPILIQATAMAARLCHSVSLCVLLCGPIARACPDEQLVEAAKKLTGDIQQVPPMYSALHHNVSELCCYTWLHYQTHCDSAVAMKSVQQSPKGRPCDQAVSCGLFGITRLPLHIAAD